MLDNFSYLYSDKPKEEVEGALLQNIEAALHKKYGQQPDQAITERVRQEWHAIEVNGNTFDVAILHELCVWMRQAGYTYWLNGSTGSSFILYLLGVAAGNPLLSHYHCPKCGCVVWRDHYKSGFDLPPDAVCEKDGGIMQGDGQGIPWQTLWGYRCEPVSLNIRVAAELCEPLYHFFEDHWLSKIDPQIAPTVPHPEHPSLFCFSNISFDVITKTQSLPENFRARIGDASYRAVALENWRMLVHSSDEIIEYMTPPDTFADLVYLAGLLHSTGTWDEECAFMIDYLGYSPSDTIAFRDDVYKYLIEHDFLEKDAWRGMNQARKGMSLPVVTEEMKNSRDKWVLDRCERTEYLFPKSHEVEYILFLMKTVAHPENTHRMSVGYIVIDDGLGGLDKSDVILLGARVGMGKTAFAVDIAYNLVSAFDKKVAIFTTADKSEDISAGIKRRTNTRAKTRANLSVYAEESLSVELIREKLNIHKADMIVVDCLQSLYRTKRKSAAHSEAIMRKIKQLATDLGVPILLLSQLSRKIEQRKDHIPHINDVPQFKSVAPFADSILLLYREAYYNFDADRSAAWCFIEKNARGGLGALPLIWNDEKMGFENSTAIALRQK